MISQWSTPKIERVAQAYCDFPDSIIQSYTRPREYSIAELGILGIYDCWPTVQCIWRVNVNVIYFFIYLLFSHRYFLYNGNVLYFFYPILIFAIIHWVHVLTISGYVRPWLTSNSDTCVLPAIRSSIVRYVWRVEVYVVDRGWVVCIYTYI